MTTALHSHPESSHPESVAAPRHLKVTGAAPAFGYEPCEDVGCAVQLDGRATSCGRVACPACGCSGTNLFTVELVDSLTRRRVRCTCGYSWVRSEQVVFGPAH